METLFFVINTWWKKFLTIISKEKFCDYCGCDDCKYGRKDLSTAKTVDGKNICDVCFIYELCVQAQRDAGAKVIQECSEKTCEHRPKLLTSWKKFNEWKK